MPNTFYKKAKESYLNTTFSDIKLKRLKEIDIDKLNSDGFKFLILQTPIQDRNKYYFKTKEQYGINSKNTDTFLKRVCNVLDIGDNFYPFSAFEPKYENINKRDNLVSKLHSANRFMFLYVGNSIVESLFCSLRDAFAHGNILKDEKKYYIFSSKKIDDNNTKLKFVLCVDNIDKLFRIKDVLKEFENGGNDK